MTSALDNENAYFQPDILRVDRQVGSMGRFFQKVASFSPDNLTIE